MSLLVELFIISFFINLLYEILHSPLYETCLKASLPKYVYLILKGAIFDGFWISAIYTITYLIFQSISPFEEYRQLLLFVAVSLILAYIWEIYAINHKRWKYAKKMPLLLGVGITPLLQLALTGLLAFYWLF